MRAAVDPGQAHQHDPDGDGDRGGGIEPDDRRAGGCVIDHVPRGERFAAGPIEDRANRAHVWRAVAPTDLARANERLVRPRALHDGTDAAVD